MFPGAMFAGFYEADNIGSVFLRNLLFRIPGPEGQEILFKKIKCTFGKMKSCNRKMFQNSSATDFTHNSERRKNR
uniref:Uncharacterized protein n=1 Tax=Chlorocebus sabaeus TaxID=60711 RepID=A0A0D9S4K2_CHLSB